MNVVGCGTAKNNGYDTENVPRTSKKPFIIPVPEKEMTKKGSNDDTLEDMDEALTEYMKRRMTVLMQAAQS
jgi:hypothetical protein